MSNGMKMKLSSLIRKKYDIDKKRKNLLNFFNFEED